MWEELEGAPVEKGERESGGVKGLGALGTPAGGRA